MSNANPQSQPQITLIHLLSQYPILEGMAKQLSTLDLLHLAMSSRELHGHICESKEVFNSLKHESLCDGRGLMARQEYSGVGYNYPKIFKFGLDFDDEEVEVRVWNIKCDAANALPCLRCGVNVCEECRWFSRVLENADNYSRSEPHIGRASWLRNIFCHCEECDGVVERDLPVRLSECCDCNQYKRWICLACSKKEKLHWQNYCEAGRVQSNNHYNRPPEEKDAWVSEGVWITYSRKHLTFWCPCGKRAPPNSKPRCGWCLRTLKQNWSESEMHRWGITSFREAYPGRPRELFWYFVAHQVAKQANRAKVNYPSLDYDGPIAS